MLETLIQIDRSVFLFINYTLANPVTDFIMPAITNDNGLRIIYALAMIILLWKGDARLRWMVLLSALALAVTDQLSAGLLKPLIARVRPCHELSPLNLLVACGGGKSMPSAHAANAFGQAILFSFHYRKAWPYLYAYATLIALSRVFVGVHYPGDIIAGALLGAIVGLILALTFRVFYRTIRKPIGEDRAVQN